jgi:carbon monoxide dehydrogenase subunit G
MATLHASASIAAAPEEIWDAARDVGALHTRLVPGFVVDTKLDGAVRVVTFGNGVSVHEPIVSIDDERRRLAWSSVGGKTTHYNAVLEIVPEGSGSRVTWTIDLLPDELAPMIEGMQKQGLAVMKQTFERG